MRIDDTFDLSNLTIVTRDAEASDCVSVSVHHLTDDAIDGYDTMTVCIDEDDAQALFPRLGYWSASHAFAAHRALETLGLEGYRLIGSYFGHKCVFIGVKS